MVLINGFSPMIVLKFKIEYRTAGSNKKIVGKENKDKTKLKTKGKANLNGKTSLTTA